MRTSALIGIFFVAILGFTLLGNAGGCEDTDGDGSACGDVGDNCVNVPNGPLGSTDACDDQEDGDMDGYGNACDSDFNNNGFTDLVDVGSVLAAAVAVSTDNNYDTNCTGFADLLDVGRALGDAAAVKVPGPSGYACAGSIPCP